MKKIILLTAVFFCCLQLTHAQHAGDLDSSFGGKGWVTEDFIKINRNSESALQVLPQGNGLYIVAITGSNALGRFLSDGTLDNSFGKEGYLFTKMSLTKAAQQSDGKILVSGIISDNTVPGGNIFNLVRYNTDGSLDSTFSDDGRQTNDFDITSIAIQNDGKIVAAGSVSGFAIARYNADGSPDLSFDGDGKLVYVFFEYNDEINSIVVQSDGKIIVAGTIFIPLFCSRCTPEDGNTESVLVRFNSDGTLDHGFGDDGKIINNNGKILAMQSDGKIVLAGERYNGTDFDINLERYNSDGLSDPDFNKDGRHPADFGYNEYPTSVALQSDGKILVTAWTASDVTYENRPENIKNFALARYNSDGTLDSSFDVDGKLTTDFGFNDFANSVAVQSDGKIIVVGRTTGTNNWDFAFARYNSDGSLDNTFGNAGKIIGYVGVGVGSLNSIAVQSDGKKVVAGNAQDSLGRFNFFISRYNLDGTPDNTFSGDGKQLIDFGYSYASLSSLAIQHDGKLVVAGSVYIYGVYPNSDITHFALARFNTDGSFDSTFSGDGRQITNFGNKYLFTDVSSVAIQDDGKIVVGAAATDTALNRDFAIVRYNLDGSLDNTFNSDGKQTTDFSNFDVATSLAILSNGKIVVAGKTLNGSNLNFIIARYNQDGSLDKTFSGDGKQTTDFASTRDHANSVAIQIDGKIVVAGSTQINGTNDDDFAIARYNSDGSPDTTFKNNGKLTIDFGSFEAAFSANLQTDGKIVIVGSAFNTNFIGDIAIVRLNSDGSFDSSFGSNGRLTSDFDGDERGSHAVIFNNKLYVAGNNIIAAYNLEDNNNVTLSCPSSKVISTDKGRCDAIVNNIDAVLQNGNTLINYTLSGATTASGTRSVSGKAFNKGVTTVTYSLANDASKNCSFTLTVKDEESPSITNVTADPASLWPPNHKMQKVTISYDINDNCGFNPPVLSVSSNEANNADWIVVDNHHVQLRAEKGRKGTERIYTITISVTDLSGNKSVKTINVSVSKDKTKAKNKLSAANRSAIIEEEDVQSLIIKATPNPSLNYFTLLTKNNSDKPLNVTVTDVLGRVVETRLNIAANGKLQLGSNYRQGIYFVEIMQGTQRQLIKVLKY